MNNVSVNSFFHWRIEKTNKNARPFFEEKLKEVKEKERFILCCYETKSEILTLS